MSATTTRLPRAEAVTLAWELVALLGPFCERLEVCGSIRRGRETIGDIELVAIPKMGEPTKDLFGASVLESSFSWLDSELVSLLNRLVVSKREPVKWGDRFKAMVYRGFPVDLFIVRPPDRQWGVLQLIRTGSNDFAHRLVTPDDRHAFSPEGRDLGQGWMPPFMFCKKGSLWRIKAGGPFEQVQTPEELHVFAAIGRAFVDPDQREV